ncbi:MAG TPA: hemerythrin domain-containing protein [Pseudonocardia sp.]|nr:hemerythrin domain-containing protein [Pseudonocardia sp.]
MTAADAPLINDFTMMLVIHDAFRRDVRRIGDVLTSAADGAPVTPDRAAAVLERWRWVTEQVHHHHGGEDAALWPALRTAVGDDAAVRDLLDRMEDEHRALGPREGELDRNLRAFAAAPSPGRARSALTAWRAFSEVFLAHLAHEERAAVPVLERRLPPEALRRFEADQQRALGLRVTMTRFFPWLIEDASPHRRQHVLGLLPAPLRWVVLRSLPRHRRRTARAWS